MNSKCKVTEVLKHNSGWLEKRMEEVRDEAEQKNSLRTWKEFRFYPKDNEMPLKNLNRGEAQSAFPIT